ncbi:hypothetical protein C8R44DRAFT_750527 [Mycena epipterygia]|nr:hypothetical protein C8R44DRAFT_750527 [Mycena epipterygia]
MQQAKKLVLHVGLHRLLTPLSIHSRDFLGLQNLPLKTLNQAYIHTLLGHHRHFLHGLDLGCLRPSQAINRQFYRVHNNITLNPTIHWDKEITVTYKTMQTIIMVQPYPYFNPPPMLQPGFFPPSALSGQQFPTVHPIMPPIYFAHSTAPPPAMLQQQQGSGLNHIVSYDGPWFKPV